MRSSCSCCRRSRIRLAAALALPRLDWETAAPSAAIRMLAARTADTGSHQAHTPRLHHALLVGHDAVERWPGSLEDEIEPQPIAFPQVQRRQAGDRHPLQPSLHVLGEGFAVPAID